MPDINLGKYCANLAIKVGCTWAKRGKTKKKKDQLAWLPFYTLAIAEEGDVWIERFAIHSIFLMADVNGNDI